MDERSARQAGGRGPWASPPRACGRGVKRQEGTAPAAGAAKAPAPAILQSAEELRVEVRRLRAALQSVTNQRDIPKKTVGIFAGPSGSVSP